MFWTAHDLRFTRANSDTAIKTCTKCRITGKILYRSKSVSSNARSVIPLKRNALTKGTGAFTERRADICPICPNHRRRLQRREIHVNIIRSLTAPTCILSNFKRCFQYFERGSSYELETSSKRFEIRKFCARSGFRFDSINMEERYID